MQTHFCQLLAKVVAVSCDFCCVFGMSNPVPGIEPGSVTTVFRPRMSYLIIGGKGGRVFWFHFFKLAKRAYGSDIPRYMKGDEAPILKERENDNITPSVTFGDLVRNKLASNMTALPVFTFKKWHFDRIVTIGDSVHKVSFLSRSKCNANDVSSTLLPVKGAISLLKVLRHSRVV